MESFVNIFINKRWSYKKSDLHRIAFEINDVINLFTMTFDACVKYKTSPKLSTAECKTAATPMRQQWSYCGLALSHRYTLVLLFVDICCDFVSWSGYSPSLAFVRGIHRWPVNSPYKGPVTCKMFPFDDVIMRSEWVMITINAICYYRCRLISPAIPLSLWPL